METFLAALRIPQEQAEKLQSETGKILLAVVLSILFIYYEFSLLVSIIKSFVSLYVQRGDIADLFPMSETKLPASLKHTLQPPLLLLSLLLPNNNSSNKMTDKQVLAIMHSKLSRFPKNHSKPQQGLRQKLLLTPLGKSLVSWPTS